MFEFRFVIIDQLYDKFSITKPIEWDLSDRLQNQRFWRDQRVWSWVCVFAGYVFFFGISLDLDFHFGNPIGFLEIDKARRSEIYLVTRDHTNHDEDIQYPWYGYQIHTYKSKKDVLLIFSLLDSTNSKLTPINHVICLPAVGFHFYIDDYFCVFFYVYEYV